MAVAYEELADSLAKGRVLSFGTGTTIEPRNGKKWSQQRTILASDIRRLLQSRKVSDPRGLMIRGARIQGVLDLTGFRVKFPLVFHHCWFEQTLQLVGSYQESVSLLGSVFPGISAEHMSVQHGFNMHAVRSGTIDARSARVGGVLGLSKARITASGEEAIDLADADVANSIDLTQARVSGLTMLIGVRVGGQVSAVDARFENRRGMALLAEAARIERGAFFNNAILRGGASFVGANIGGEANFGQTEVDGRGGDALVFDRAQVDGTLIFDGLKAKGTVRLLGADVRGQLRSSRVEIDGGDSEVALGLEGAILAQNARFDGSNLRGAIRASGLVCDSWVSMRNMVVKSSGLALHLDNGRVRDDLSIAASSFEGEVRLIDAVLGGQFTASDTTISADGEDALYMAGCKVGSDLTLSRLRLLGTLAVTDCEVAGTATFSGSVITAASVAINLSGSRIGADTYFVAGSVIGTMLVDSTYFSGDVTFDGLSIRAPIALRGTTTTFARGLYLGVSTTGVMMLIKSQVQAQCRLRLGSTDKSSVTSLLLPGSSFEWLVIEEQECEVEIDLTSCRILRLDTDELKRVRFARAVGWSLGTIHGPLRHSESLSKRVLSRLQLDGKRFVSQPWMEFARSLDESGERRHAKKTRITALWRAANTGPVALRPFHWGFGLAVAHGYSPLRAFLWIALAWVLAFGLAYTNSDSFTPADWRAVTTVKGGGYTVPDAYLDFNPALWAVDIAVPAADTGQARAWILDSRPRLQLLFAAIKLWSWVMVALFVAGVTGLLRRS